jgi:multisubunit Na+/H+ antiporter MnhC subunit
VLDRLIKGVLGAITRLVQGLLTILPIPGLNKIMGLVRAYLRVAVGLLDEVMLAHAIRTKSDNPFASAREALVLYGQNAKPIMINAVWLTAIVYGLSLVVFVLMLAPAAAVVYLMPGTIAAGGVVFALLFAWAAKAALIEPFAIACMLQVFFKVTEGQTPNPEWEEKLTRASDKFRKLGEKAASWVGVKAAAEAPAAPPGD